MDDIKTTAIRSLWSKNRLQIIDFELYAQTVVQNCSVCGCTPPGVLTYKRQGVVYTLHWCHVQYDLENNLKPVCPTCKWLLTNNDLRSVLTTCARIMARITNSDTVCHVHRGVSDTYC